jgi:riboflavin kinase/FMN adenylyltransferase
MHIYNSLENIPSFKNTVITIGSFDGVHRGHQKILAQVKNLATKMGGQSIVITFYPHPRKVVAADEPLQLLTTIEEKIALLDKFGIDNVVIVPFSKEFSQQSPDAYIEDFLIKNFHPSCIVIGYDHRFGQGRVGDIAYLKKYEAKHQFQVVEIAKHTIDDIAISSTKIRTALLKGDIATANSLLNYTFSFSGKVVLGNQIGRTIGFPTANLEVENKDKLIVPQGIYAANVYHNNTKYYGMLYIGNRPTLEHLNNTTIEVNIFDFEQDIYGANLTIEVTKWLREDKKFDSLEALKRQLKEDKREASPQPPKGESEVGTTVSTETLRNTLFEEQSASSSLEQERVELLRTPPLGAGGILLLNYNGRHHLEQFLPSVVAYSGNCEIIIADNASTDDSVDFLEKNYPNIQIIQLDKNYGFAEGYNQAIRFWMSDFGFRKNQETRNSKPETRNSKPETRNSKPETRNPKLETRNSKLETRNSKLETRNSKPETRNSKLETSNFLILLNSDIEVTPNWTEPLLETLRNNPNVAACQPKIKAFYRKTHFEFAGAAGGWMDVLGYPFCRGRLYYDIEEDKGQYDEVQSVAWASGAAMAVRAELFLELGGFDADYFAHMEEIDWCWRAQRAGYQLLAVPSSTVYHVGGGTLDYKSPRKTFLNFRNSIFTSMKNEPASKLIWWLPLRLCLDGLAGGLFLVRGEFRNIWAIIQAHFAFYGAFVSILKKRKQYSELIENQRIGVENKDGRYKKSILWAYFGRKKKKFSELG